MQKYKHGLSNHPLFKTWQQIQQRCYNTKNNRYNRYGARGITVCRIWCDSFAAFFEWATNNGWAPEFSLERKNNDKGYSPSNCKWATDIEQANNKSSNFIVTYKSEEYTFQQLFNLIGHSSINSHIALHRYKDGMSLKKACCTPLKVNRKRNQSIIIKTKVLNLLKTGPKNWLDVEESIVHLIENKHSSYTRWLLSKLKKDGLIVNQNNMWYINEN